MWMNFICDGDMKVKSNEFGWDKRCDPEWSSSLNTMAITNLNSTINKV